MNISMAGKLAPARAVKLNPRSRKILALNIRFGIINLAGALKSITWQMFARMTNLAKASPVGVFQRRFATALDRRNL